MFGLHNNNSSFLCDRVAEDGDVYMSCKAVSECKNIDVMCKQVDENLAITQELKLPVVAPALKNLGMFSYYLIFVRVVQLCYRHFDTVGWVTGRVSVHRTSA